MRKTFVTTMPNHIGSFLKASKCFSSIGINITRVSYNKSVDSHMLFIDAEGTEEQLKKAAEDLMEIGYLQCNTENRDIVLLEFKLKDTPGSVTPILELINDYKFNISYISSQENDTNYQYFKMGLIAEGQTRIDDFMKEAKEQCDLRIIKYDQSNKIYDNSFFYNNFVNELAKAMDITDGAKNELIVNTNLAMQILDETGVSPYKTFESISKLTEILSHSRCENFDARITTHKITENTEIILIEPPCGSNTAIIKSMGRYLFVDTGYACFEEEMIEIIKSIIPNFDDIEKKVFITHADVDHCGLLNLFDVVYASAKSAESLKLEHEGEGNFREKNPLHKPYIGICNILTSYKTTPPDKLKIIGENRHINRALEQTGIFDFGELHFKVYEGKGGHLKGESILIDFKHHITFTGDIFINMKDMIPKQAEYNMHAPILMTSVDSDKELCAIQRRELFKILSEGSWQIFGGHGAKSIHNITKI